MQTFYQTLKSTPLTSQTALGQLARVTQADVSRLTDLQALGGWGTWGQSAEAATR